MVSGHWVFVPDGNAAAAEQPVSSVAHTYDKYRVDGKWVWNDYAGDSTDSNAFVHPAWVILFPKYPFPAITASPDEDDHMYKTWSGGWRPDN